jgi:hypothetical protein
VTVRRKAGAVRGAGKVRRLLKRLPADVSGEMVGVLRDKAPAITAYSKMETPSLTGGLRGKIDWKVYPKSTSLRVGLIGKAANRQFFYARILEGGRGFKRTTSKTIRRRLAGGGLSKAYRMVIRRISSGRYDFTRGRAAKAASRILKPDLEKVWQRALSRAAEGGGE